MRQATHPPKKKKRKRPKKVDFVVRANPQKSSMAWFSSSQGEPAHPQPNSPLSLALTISQSSSDTGPGVAHGDAGWDPVAELLEEDHGSRHDPKEDDVFGFLAPISNDNGAFPFFFPLQYKNRIMIQSSNNT